MSAIHATSTVHAQVVGDCQRLFAESHGVWLWCSNRALLLGALCADCLIEWAAVQPASYWIVRDRMAGVGR